MYSILHDVVPNVGAREWGVSPNLKVGLHILPFVLFLLQRKDLIGYIAEVRIAASKITLGLGYFLGTHDTSLREIRDSC